MLSVSEAILRYRNIGLTLVFLLALIVHFLFLAFSLLDPVSLFGLFFFSVFLYLVVLVFERSVIQPDITEALSTQVYPARFRAPLNSEFSTYILVWLAWWIISQLFFDAGVLYEHGFVLQFVLIPLVTFAIGVNMFSDSAARYRRYVNLALLFVTFVTLFFPTTSWAPQHANIFFTGLRGCLYFLSLLTFEYTSPGNFHVDVSSAKVHRHEFGHRAVLLADEKDERHRGICVDTAVEMVQKIYDEKWRPREFVAMSAWILVTPMSITLMLYFATLFATIGTSRRLFHSLIVAVKSPLPQQAAVDQDYYVQQPPHSQHSNNYHFDASLNPHFSPDSPDLSIQVDASSFGSQQQRQQRQQPQPQPQQQQQQQQQQRLYARNQGYGDTPTYEQQSVQWDRRQTQPPQQVVVYYGNSQNQQQQRNMPVRDRVASAFTGALNQQIVQSVATQPPATPANQPETTVTRLASPAFTVGRRQY